jgi:hypothetical protein
MPIHDIQKRRQYYRNRYHKLKPQKQKELPVLNEQVDQTILIEPTKQEEPPEIKYSINLYYKNIHSLIYLLILLFLNILVMNIYK